jgi:hypothetical protein
MRRALLSTVTALLVAFSMATAQGAETVWSALVMANNRAEPTPMPRELSRLERTLQRFFNYNQYQVIGSSRQTLATGEEDWQTPANTSRST